MKLGKGGHYVLGMPLHCALLPVVGFLFGFISGLGFNQVIVLKHCCRHCSIDFATLVLSFATLRF
jgi:hypothetical protein